MNLSIFLAISANISDKIVIIAFWEYFREGEEIEAQRPELQDGSLRDQNGDFNGYGNSNLDFIEVMSHIIVLHKRSHTPII